MAFVGDPDYLLCCNGKFIALELKAEDGIVSEKQQLNLDQVTKAHGVSIVARPSNWEGAKYLLGLYAKGDLK